MNNLLSKPHTLFVIVGPTAVGKTAVSIQLAQQLGCPILSADSRQFYREMKIGIAAPTDAELALVKHYFIANKSVTEDYNISQYESDALALMSGLFYENPNLVMVGGSGLYVNAVCNGIDDMPDTDPAIRIQLKELLKAEGIGVLQQRLSELDPEYYKEVDQRNPVRLQRALEVYIQTGKPYSHFRMKVKKERDFNIVKIGIEIEKAVLNQRIEERVDRMMAEGQLEEVKSLLPFRQYNALNTVGYKELFAYLDGSINLEQAIINIKTNTRQYAKRQLTWFRKDNEIHWFFPEQIINLIESQGNIGEYRLFR